MSVIAPGFFSMNFTIFLNIHVCESGSEELLMKKNKMKKQSSHLLSIAASNAETLQVVTLDIILCLISWDTFGENLSPQRSPKWFVSSRLG